MDLSLVSENPRPDGWPGNQQPDQEGDEATMAPNVRPRHEIPDLPPWDCLPWRISKGARAPLGGAQGRRPDATGFHPSTLGRNGLERLPRGRIALLS